MFNPTNIMTVNQQSIYQHAPRYIDLYTKKFGTRPTSWFSFFRWLGSFTPANSFDSEDVELAKKLLLD